MRLLIVTQAVDRDDPVLGFFQEWIREFAKNCEQVHVICLREGIHDDIKNVSIHSLGKESGASRLKYIFRFYRYIWSLRHEYDAVFVHMNPEYVVLGGLLWRLWGKTIGLWYVHTSVTWLLRCATLFVDMVFTSSKESFRISSRKVNVMGHGIPILHFNPRSQTESDVLRVITVGRVSKTKRIREMLLALDELGRRGVRCSFTIVGAPATAADVEYQENIKSEIASRTYPVSFTGPLQYAELSRVFSHADLFLNLSATASMDKAVLESFASGVPSVSSNVAFKDVLEEYGLFSHTNEPSDIANAIEKYVERPDRAQLVGSLRAYVEKNHALSRLVLAILQKYKDYVRN